MPLDLRPLAAQLQPFHPPARVTDEPVASSEESAQPSPESTVIEVPGNRSITTVAAKLYAVLSPTGRFYCRGRAIVELETLPNGTLGCVPLNPAAARSRFETGISWVKMTRNGREPCILSEDLSKALMQAQERCLLPALHGVLEVPALVGRSGQLVLLKPGYNAEEGLLVQRGSVPEEVPLAEAIEAIQNVLLGDYDFATPSDKARAVAALLTPGLNLGRLLHGRLGLIVVEADDSQTGKGYLVRLISALYGEVPTCFAKSKGGVGGFDESLDQALIWGRLIISIDNVRGMIASEKLESLLTEPTYQARIPYSPAVAIDPTRFVIFLTSNGAEMTTDLANRSLLIRIRKRAASRFRQFQEGDLLAHVAARQPHFLGCVHAVIRAWHAAGRPQTDEARHSKRGWIQVCDWIVQKLFTLPPLLDGHTQVLDRAAMRFLGFVRRLAIAVDQRGRLGQTLRARELFTLAVEHSIEVPCLKAGNEFDDDLGPRAVGMAMQSAFRGKDAITVDEYLITRTEFGPDECSHHTTRVYDFQKQDFSGGNRDDCPSPQPDCSSGIPQQMAEPPPANLPGKTWGLKRPATLPPNLPNPLEHFQ